MIAWLGQILDTFRDFSEDHLTELRKISLLSCLGGLSLFAAVKRPYWFRQYSSEISQTLFMSGSTLKGQVKGVELECERVSLQLLHIPQLKRRIDSSQVMHAKLYRVHYPSDYGFDKWANSLLNAKVKFDIVGHSDHIAEVVLFRRRFLFFKQNVNRALVKKNYAKEDAFTLQESSQVKEMKYSPLDSGFTLFRKKPKT